MKHEDLQKAVAALKAGQCIVYPTEAVYGMGCDPKSESAVSLLLEIKQRPVEKGLILIADNIEQLNDFVDFSLLPQENLEQIKASWPGAVTWLLPAKKGTPEFLTGGSELIATRVTNHVTVKQLCQLFGGAIISTSANLTGQPTPDSIEQLQAMFKEQIAAYVDQPLGGNNKPSTIKHGLTGDVLRG